METLPSSADGLGHNLLQNHPQPIGVVLLQRANLEKEVVESPTTEIRMEASTKADPDGISEGEQRQLQYAERQPGTRSHMSWGMGKTNLGWPT